MQNLPVLALAVNVPVHGPCFTAEERETTIRLSDAEDTAYVCTYQVQVYRRLTRLGYRPVREVRKGHRIIGGFFEVPAAVVLLRRPPKVSDRQREAGRMAARNHPLGQNAGPRPGVSERKVVEG